MNIRQLKQVGKKKWIIAAVTVVAVFLVALAIEFIGFQHNLLFSESSHKGTFTYDLTDLQKSGFQEQGDRLVAVREDAKLRLQIDRMYVDKLEYGYHSSKSYTGTISVLTYDGYDSPITKEMADSSAYQLERSVQNIRMDVSEITITVPEGTEISYLQIHNNIQFNPLRYLFLCVVLFFIVALLVFRRLWARKVEAGFLLVAVCVGILLLFLSPNKNISWDEQIHFDTAYEMSFRSRVPWTESAWQIKNVVDANSYSIEERADAQNYMNEHSDYNQPVRIDQRGKLLPYKNYGYLTQAAMLTLGRKLNLPFSVCHTMGRMGNFLLYAFMMYMAIRNIKIGKRVMALIALMPTPLFLASVYTYDAVITSFLMVALSILVNELLEPKKRLSFGNAFLFVGLTVFACMPKAVYIFLLLLGLLLPESKFQNKSSKWIFKIGLVVIFCILMSTYLFAAVVNPEGSSDARGGDTDVGKQLGLILGHPLSFLEILFKDMQASSGPYLIGSPSLLHYAYLDEHNTYNLQIAMGALVIFTALTDTYGEKDEDGQILQLKGSNRLFLALVVLATAVMTWTALYIAFTPVGLDRINGVQGRYYIPLLFPFFLLFRSKKIQNHINPETYHTILFGGAAFLSMFMIYHHILKPLCF